MNQYDNLLETMVSDAKNVDELYQPTNYWKNYTDKILDTIKKEDLQNIRSKDTVFKVFGGSDVQTDYFRLQKNNRFIPQTLAKFFTINSRISKEDLQRLAYYQAYYYDTIYNIHKLNKVSVSTAWNPADVFKMDGKHYTITFLQYYLQYAYMSRLIDFNKIKIFIDLGCGMSKVSEIIHKLHPNVMILLFDIVPTVYLTEKYMESIFPESVIGYTTTKSLTDLNYEKGKIYVFPNWKFPIISTLPSVDVFMNSGSFQEMEIPIVRNYLSYVNQKAIYVYLRAAMKGSERAKFPGNFGSIEPVTFKDYYSSLKEYDILNRSQSVFPLVTKAAYEDVVFRRKNN